MINRFDVKIPSFIFRKLLGITFTSFIDLYRAYSIYAEMNVKFFSDKPYLPMQ